ncbi:hypothetical protein FN846DRAFT_275202 [Sphaerosporella brunnea]|uniref:Uncharacterized protein n=1 Tax=Sphaerosporella brunnea TaxID=1250544 RepID=A0A5J5EME6_9PEZI|nr:hypothetical protein FN846DRAFT_275202 [Sphaerosporella brunnea]
MGGGGGCVRFLCWSVWKKERGEQESGNTRGKGRKTLHRRQKNSWAAASSPTRKKERKQRAEHRFLSRRAIAYVRISNYIPLGNTLDSGDLVPGKGTELPPVAWMRNGIWSRGGQENKNKKSIWNPAPMSRRRRRRRRRRGSGGEARKRMESQIRILALDHNRPKRDTASCEIGSSSSLECTPSLAASPSVNSEPEASLPLRQWESFQRVPDKEARRQAGRQAGALASQSMVSGSPRIKECSLSPSFRSVGLAACVPPSPEIVWNAAFCGCSSKNPYILPDTSFCAQVVPCHVPANYPPTRAQNQCYRHRRSRKSRAVRGK